MSLRTEEIDGVVVAHILEESLLDQLAVARVRSALESLLTTLKPTSLVLDFSQCRYLASAALGMLVTYWKNVRASGGTLRLCGFDESLTDVLQAAALDRILCVSLDVSSAVADIHTHTA